MPCFRPQADRARCWRSETELAPALVALHAPCRRRTTDSRAARRPRPRVRRRARRGSRTTRPAGPRPRAAARSRPEAVAGALLGQKRRRAAALVPEMEIEPDGRAADAEPADQDARDELLRGRGWRSAASKVSTSAPSSPVAASSRSFDRSSVRRNTGSDGRSTLRGCGSNVTAIAGRRARAARERRASITARCPRCTPSKLPIAATAPLQRGRRRRHVRR